MYLAFCIADLVQSTLVPSEQNPCLSGGLTDTSAISKFIIYGCKNNMYEDFILQLMHDNSNRMIPLYQSFNFIDSISLTYHKYYVLISKFLKCISHKSYTIVI